MTSRLPEWLYPYILSEYYYNKAKLKPCRGLHSRKPQLDRINLQDLCPGGSGPVQGILAEQITNDFGSFDNFKKTFTDTAASVEESSWTLLVWSPCFKELEIIQAEKHQDLTQWGVIPLLVFDAWNPVNDLNYQDKRASWIDAWWSFVNWLDVRNLFEENIENYTDINAAESY